jgi:2,3-bisphosphoglycerate-independent phosphoglycerate mutase
MVGHTGDLQAAIKAIETVDTCLGRVVEAQLARAGEVLVTADHGNAELMRDTETGQAHTAHTLNLVPLIYVGRRHSTLAETGALEDVSPTLLKMMGLSAPPEMTGQALVQFE